MAKHVVISMQYGTGTFYLLINYFEITIDFEELRWRGTGRRSREGRGWVRTDAGTNFEESTKPRCKLKITSYGDKPRMVGCGGSMVFSRGDLRPAGGDVSLEARQGKDYVENHDTGRKQLYLCSIPHYIARSAPTPSCRAAPSLGTLSLLLWEGQL